MKTLRVSLALAGLLLLSASTLSAQSTRISCQDGTKPKVGHFACWGHGGLVREVVKSEPKVEAKSPARTAKKVEVKTPAKAAKKVEVKAPAKAAKKVEARSTAKTAKNAEVKPVKPKSASTVAKKSDKKAGKKVADKKAPPKHVAVKSSAQ